MFCNLKQAKAEQEEEFISNTLMKKIQALKKEKEILAMNYEQEEEYLTNDLSKKLSQVISCYILYIIVHSFRNFGSTLITSIVIRKVVEFRAIR